MDPNAIASLISAVVAAGSLLITIIAMIRNRGAIDARVEVGLENAATKAEVEAAKGEIMASIGAKADLETVETKLTTLREHFDHHSLQGKIDGLREKIEMSSSTLHEKINNEVSSMVEGRRKDYADFAEKLTNIRTDLAVLSEGVGRMIDTMERSESSITSLLADSSGDNVRMKQLEMFKQSAETKLNALELMLENIRTKIEGL